MRAPRSPISIAMAPLAFMASSRPPRSSTLTQSGLLSNTCRARACWRPAASSMSCRTTAAARTLARDRRNAVSAATKSCRAVLSTSSTPYGAFPSAPTATLIALCTPCSARSAGMRNRPSLGKLLDSTGALVCRAYPAGLSRPPPRTAWPTTPARQPTPATISRSPSGCGRSTFANSVCNPSAAIRHVSCSTGPMDAAPSAYRPSPATSSCWPSRMASSSGGRLKARAVKVAPPCCPPHPIVTQP